MSSKSTSNEVKRIMVDGEIHDQLQTVLQILRKNTRGIQNRNHTINQNDVIRFLLDSSSNEILRVYGQVRDSESTYRRTIGVPRSGERERSGWNTVQAQLDADKRREAESKEEVSAKVDQELAKEKRLKAESKEETGNLRALLKEVNVSEGPNADLLAKINQAVEKEKRLKAESKEDSQQETEGSSKEGS